MAPVRPGGSWPTLVAGYPPKSCLAASKSAGRYPAGGIPSHPGEVQQGASGPRNAAFGPTPNRSGPLWRPIRADRSARKDEIGVLAHDRTARPKRIPGCHAQLRGRSHRGIFYIRPTGGASFLKRVDIAFSVVDPNPWGNPGAHSADTRSGISRPFSSLVESVSAMGDKRRRLRSDARPIWP